MNLSELRKLAEKATKGKWRVGFKDGSGRNSDEFPHSGGAYITTRKDTVIVRGGEADGPHVGVLSEHDAKYIAACSPKTFLALLEVADAAVRANDHFPDDKLDTALTNLAKVLK